MKLLTLLRHGKSEWETGAENDFNRPLRRRGRTDGAPFMGKVFAALDLTPDLIVELASIAHATDRPGCSPSDWRL